MFICKWEPMDKWGNAIGPDVDTFSFILFGFFITVVVIVLLLDYFGCVL